jgi:hypothetical protein
MCDNSLHRNPPLGCAYRHNFLDDTEVNQQNAYGKGNHESFAHIVFDIIRVITFIDYGNVCMMHDV